MDRQQLRRYYLFNVYKDLVLRCAYTKKDCFYHVKMLITVWILLVRTESVLILKMATNATVRKDGQAKTATVIFVKCL